MAIKAGTVFVDVLPDMSKFAPALQSQAKSFDKVGKSMTRIGATMTRRVTLPILGIGAAAITSAVRFESGFAGVRKTVDATEKQFADLEQGIRDMAKEIPSSTEEISAVAEMAGQLGIETPNILEFTRTMIDLGNSTNLSADQAASALARLANITQLPQNQIDRLGSTIVDLGNNMATTEAEITEMALRIAGAGSQVGLTEDQILSFAGALSSVGIRADAGGSAISRTFIEIANAVASGGKGLQSFADVAGASAEEYRRAFEDDAASATIMFIEGLARIDKEGGNVFAVLDKLGLGEIRVRDALLRAAGAGDLFRESLELGSDAWRENTALTEEANKRYATSESQLRILLNRLKDIGITLGRTLLPVFQDVAESVVDLVEKWEDLDKGTQEIIIKAALVAAALGPVVFLLGGAARGVGFLLKGGASLFRLATAITGVGTAAKTAGGTAQLGGFVGLLKTLGAGSAGLGAALTASVATAAATWPQLINNLMDNANWDEGEMAATKFVDSFQAGLLKNRIVEETGFIDELFTWDSAEDTAQQAAAVITDEMNRAIANGADPEAVQRLVDNQFYELRNAVGGVNEDPALLREVVRKILGGDTRGQVRRSAALLLDDIGVQFNNWVEALEDSGENSSPVARQLVALRNGFADMIGPLDENTERMVLNLLAVGDLEGAYKLLRGEFNRQWTPLKRNMKATQENAAAAAAADRAQKGLQGATRGAGTEMERSGGKADTYKGKLNDIPKNVDTDVELDGVESATARANHLKQLLEGLERTYHANVEVIQGPGRAAGGPVAAGRGYIVGEKGPEYFIPNTAGRIIPNHRLPGREVAGSAAGGGGGRMVVLEGKVDVDTGRIRAIAREEDQLERTYSRGLDRMKDR